MVGGHGRWYHGRGCHDRDAMVRGHGRGCHSRTYIVNALINVKLRYTCFKSVWLVYYC